MGDPPDLGDGTVRATASSLVGRVLCYGWTILSPGWITLKFPAA